eukprot:jgi/Hompol1/5006/HPOL_000668-RA
MSLLHSGSQISVSNGPHPNLARHLSFSDHMPDLSLIISSDIVKTTVQTILPYRTAKSSSLLIDLKYFYLYLDDTELGSQTDLAHFSGTLSDTVMPQIDISAVSDKLFPSFGSLFDSASQTASFFLLKVNLDIDAAQTGDFKNISVYESKTERVLECTTSVYSFGKLILETRQVQTPWRRPQDGKYIFHADFVGQFFSAFLSGFQFLDHPDEARVAVENLAIMQTFEDVSDIFDRRVLLCLAHEFTCGSGNVEIAQIRDFGLLE